MYILSLFIFVYKLYYITVISWVVYTSKYFIEYLLYSQIFFFVKTYYQFTIIIIALEKNNFTSVLISIIIISKYYHIKLKIIKEVKNLPLSILDQLPSSSILKWSVIISAQYLLF